ncbi:signal peptide peptidase SppA [Halorubrum vacuolatum]|uniref:Protease-4 n=1 Tax=Halorubrum vacuolatum TaxID=63740 RepID=A0A238UMN5_HALVU|nr:signal peptide peptidase SppA [Halorubrum vacuolatum]SNR23191.1 protease-4 [Halorubrum vacuolatum]
MDEIPRSKGRVPIVATAVAVTAAALACRRIVARFTRGRLGGADEYNVAEVPVSGPIVRDRGRPSPLSGGTATTADEVVELIEEADEDEAVDALLLRINTPGGQVLPSDDIRRAAADFDGPTVAYATDLCASGGYWIASGCDELWAHDASLVGSIGVIGSRPNAAELADRLGISYEQFTAGEYKDAGVPLREIEDDEREYLQGIIDGYYERFVETVSEGRDMDPEDVRDTEARIYLGSDAAEVGLVDSLGTREDVEDRLSALLDADVEVRELQPQRGFAERLGIGAERLAFAAGNGVASVFSGSGGDVEIELR